MAFATFCPMHHMPLDLHPLCFCCCWEHALLLCGGLYVALPPPPSFSVSPKPHGCSGCLLSHGCHIGMCEGGKGQLVTPPVVALGADNFLSLPTCTSVRHALKKWGKKSTPDLRGIWGVTLSRSLIRKFMANRAQGYKQDVYVGECVNQCNTFRI